MPPECLVRQKSRFAGRRRLPCPCKCAFKLRDRGGPLNKRATRGAVAGAQTDTAAATALREAELCLAFAAGCCASLRAASHGLSVLRALPATFAGFFQICRVLCLPEQTRRGAGACSSVEESAEELVLADDLETYMCNYKAS